MVAPARDDQFVDREAGWGRNTNENPIVVQDRGVHGIAEQKIEKPQRRRIGVESG
ncbi:hypothetical protein D3C86_2122470 [compost metagenome]